MIASSFLSVVFSSAFLSLIIFGIGKVFVEANGTQRAVTIFSGWTILLFLASVFWVFDLSFIYFKMFIGLGFWGIYKSRNQWQDILRLIGFASAACVPFALPFLFNSNLVVYALLGTDQWGYLGVSDWILRNGFQVPDLNADCSPHLSWIVKVFSLKDRPLTYSLLAAVGSMLSNKVALAYYAIPSALIGSVAFALAGNLRWKMYFLLKNIIVYVVAFQFTWFWHLQYQYWAGSVVGILFCLYLCSLAQTVLEQKESSRTHAVFIFFCICLFPLYNERFSILAVLLFATALIIGSSPKALKISRIFSSKNIIIFISMSLIAIIYGQNAMVMSEVKSMKGDVGYLLFQVSGALGQHDILPWFFSDRTPGYDPLTFYPKSATLFFVLFLVGLAVFSYLFLQSLSKKKLWFFAVWIVILSSTILYASPPSGTHLTLSRVLPICMTGLIPLGFFLSEYFDKTRMIQGVFLGISFVAFVYNIGPLYFLSKGPPNIAVKGSELKIDDPWTCLAFSHLKEDSSFDWNARPKCFHSMTHFLADPDRLAVSDKCNINKK